MYVIVFVSLVAMTVMFERLWSLRRRFVFPNGLQDRVEALIQEGRLKEAADILRRSESALGRVLLVALAHRGEPRDLLKERVEEQARIEMHYLERFVPWLGVIAAIAPLLGLLGTVIGMIEVFQNISLVGVGKADVLAGGISKALNTTAAGLVVAIPSLVAYRFFEGRLDAYAAELESAAVRIVELLRGEAR
ncbi:MAG: MotA/TolQ/ExbB proton channel family protein [Zetaproteobacteria bacterium]|nr:MAG: MotA/TolQ/ExbB proton channel family protein [Zetaproteobacteria bacterium]